MPYPANDGSSIAIRSMIDGFLANEVDLTLMSLNTLKHFKPEDETQKIKPELLKFISITANTNITIGNSTANLLSSKAFHVSRFLIPAFTQKLITLLEENEFDIVQIEGLPMAVYLPIIRKHSKTKVSLRAHNAEFQIWERTLASENNPLKKRYLQLQINRLKKFEQSVVKSVDALVTITDNDFAILKDLGFSSKHLTLPCGISLDQYKPGKDLNPEYDIIYLASFDWQPNQQGLFWFMDKVWPLILKQRPETTFALAGRRMPDSITEIQAEGFVNLGEADDMQAFIDNGKLSIVPLLAGSGMRIKIIENMALARPIISTTIGAEGIEVINDKDIVLKDEPSQFCEAIIDLLNKETKRKELGLAARKKVEERYNNVSLGAQLLSFYKTDLCYS